MFVKSIVSKGKTYLQIVESYREDNTVKHKVIANLGNLELLLANGLANIVSSLAKHIPNNNQLATKYDITTMEEKERFNYGYLAYKRLWDKYSITEILEELDTKKVKYNLSEIVFSLVVNRLLSPSSKLYHYHSKKHYIGTEEQSELHDIYRSLGLLSKNKEEIEKILFDRSRNLFNMKVDIVLYDVTTFHFESQRADELRNFGFSKANKINEVQVVMGLLVDLEGRPIGYELFPGNTFDGKTMLKMVRKLKERYELNQIIIVADKGLNSRINLKEIKDAGFDYIVSARLRNMSKKVQEDVFSEDGYKSINKDEKEGVYKYKVLDYQNSFIYKEENESGEIIKKEKITLTEKLVCSYSSKRANKDRSDRMRSIEKANKLIASKDVSRLENKKGYKRYIETKGKEKLKEMYLSKEKIAKEEQFDGYYALEYSNLSMDPEEVISRYHDLYKIEESFRVLKSTMETRPIYLRTTEHIEGHFVVCFLAFLLERELELRLRQREIEYSAEKIKSALNSMEFSEIEIEANKFYMKSKNESLGSKIFELLKLKTPKNLLTQQQLSEYLATE